MTKVTNMIGLGSDKNVLFWPKNLYICKVNFLYSDHDFCQQSISLVCHLDHPQKNFRFRAVGHFSGLTPVFGRFRFAMITLNFGLSSTTKMTHNDNEPGPGRNYGETVVFTFVGKVFGWPKMRLSQRKNTKTSLKD